EYHSIRQRASENSTEYMQRFLCLAGFLGQAAGTAEEQAKNFRWVLHKSILDHVMCIQFTDVAPVVDAASNLEILRDRDYYERSERSDKRHKSGDRYQSATQQNSYRGHDQKNDRQGSDRQGGGGNYRNNNNNNYSRDNNRSNLNRYRLYLLYDMNLTSRHGNRNSGAGRDQRNRGSQQSRVPSEGYTHPVCNTCGRRHPGECRRAAGTCFKCGQAGHLQRDCKKNTLVLVRLGHADRRRNASGGRCLADSTQIRPPILHADVSEFLGRFQNLQSTPQILSSFEVYTLPVTYSEEVKETIGIPMEVEPLDETRLEDLGLNTFNREIPHSSREVPSFKEPKPQSQPLPNCLPLDISLGDKINPEPPIKPYSLDSFRMKVVDNLTIHTPPSPHVASFHPKDVIENNFLRRPNLPMEAKELENGRIEETHHLENDYPTWEVIQNENGPVSITTDTQGQIKVLPPRTAEEIIARERERKARTTLLMALPEDHLAKFHKMTDAKEM
ncbi:zinc finger, CCHC-type, retrotransposon gag domain protein, partial [Tanacetum coccineum]